MDESTNLAAEMAAIKAELAALRERLDTETKRTGGKLDLLAWAADESRRQSEQQRRLFDEALRISIDSVTEEVALLAGKTADLSADDLSQMMIEAVNEPFAAALKMQADSQVSLVTTVMTRLLEHADGMIANTIAALKQQADGQTAIMDSITAIEQRLATLEAKARGYDDVLPAILEGRAFVRHG